VVTVLLFVAALMAGALNAVAGGGSFIALPALLYAGVPPVAANATTTIALWPASLSSAVAYRREIATRSRWLVLFGAISLIGGAIGGMLLLRTSDARFMRLLPWLMLAAAATFTFGARIVERLRPIVRNPGPAPLTSPAGSSFAPVPVWALALQLAIATYGGYFGGGIGILMLAIFSVAGMNDIHQMNGLKALLAVAINGAAVVEFIAFGAVAWPQGATMAAGGILGGYSAAWIARHVPPSYIRVLISIVAWTMTAYFFVTSM